MNISLYIHWNDTNNHVTASSIRDVSYYYGPEKAVWEKDQHLRQSEVWTVKEFRRLQKGE